MLAIVAAILFGVSVILAVARFTLGPLDPIVFLAAGLLCLALAHAGIGASLKSRSNV